VLQAVLKPYFFTLQPKTANKFFWDDFRASTTQVLPFDLRCRPFPCVGKRHDRGASV